MFSIAKLYNSACSYAVNLIRIYPIIVSIVLHHYKILKEKKFNRFYSDLIQVIIHLIIVVFVAVAVVVVLVPVAVVVVLVPVVVVLVPVVVVLVPVVVFVAVVAAVFVYYH